MQTKNIKQEVILPCSPQVAYDAWLDSKIHGEMISGNAEIDPKVGGKFNIWDGYAVGRTIELDPKRLKIVQEWRDDSTDWPKNYYSKISLKFFPQGKNQTKLVFYHSGIPEEHTKSIEEGWNDYYWKPMRRYFGEK